MQQEVATSPKLRGAADRQVLDAARNFFEAAHRCGVFRTGPTHPPPGSCVYAMGHCSVIACELFLKSVISWSYYHAEEGNNETLFPQSGTMYIVKPKVVSGFKNFTSEFDARWKCMETCERLAKEAQGRRPAMQRSGEGRKAEQLRKVEKWLKKRSKRLFEISLMKSHDGIVDIIGEDQKKTLEREMGSEDLEWLNYLSVPLGKTRYPFEGGRENTDECRRAFDTMNKMVRLFLTKEEIQSATQFPESVF